MAKNEPLVKPWYAGNPEAVYGTIKTLKGALSRWRYDDAEALRTFYAEPANTYVPTEGEAGATMYEARSRARQKHNLLRAAIESAASMIVQVPEVEVITIGASSKRRRSVRALSQWLSGVFHANDLEALLWETFLDKCLCRVSAAKVLIEADAAKIERVMPHTISWNPNQGKYPRDLFLETPYPRSSLAARFPEFEEWIMKEAPAYKPDEMFVGVDAALAGSEDMVELTEAYHTADPGPKPKNGRMTLLIGEKVVQDTEYPHDFHCIVPRRWSPSYSSFAGTPAADTLMAYQHTIDVMNEAMDESEAKGAVLRVMLPTTGETNEEELTNAQGGIIRHKPGAPPVFHGGTMLSPQYYAREEAMIQRAFAFMGVSYSAATGRKADGIPSAKGQREVRSISEHRLVLHMRAQDRFVEQLARTLVKLADHHYSEDKSAEIRAPGTKLLSRIDWKRDIDFKEGEYEFRCDSVNALSRHPSARTEEIIELKGEGLLSPKEAQRALRNRDVTALTETLFAPEDLAEKQVEEALNDNYIAPEPYQGIDGLTHLVKLGELRYTQELLEAEEERGNMEMLRDLIEQAKLTLDGLTKAPPAPAPPPDAPVDPGVPVDPGATGAVAAPPDAGAPPVDPAAPPPMAPPAA